MFQLPDIAARIKVDLNQMHDQFGQAAREADHTGGAIKEAFTKIGSFLASPITQMIAFASAAFSVHEAISEISRSMDQIDQTAKAADRIGVTMQAYQALGHEAALAGVEMGSLDMGIKQLQGSLADAAGGSADAEAKFAALGMSAKDLVNLPTEQAIGKIGDALAQIQNPAERSAAAANLFGMRAGPELLNMLTSGSQGIQDAKDEIDAMGLSLSRVDAAKVEEANDAMTRVHETIEAVVQKIAVALAPYVTGLANQFIIAGKEGGGFGDKVTTAVEMVAKGVAYAADTTHLIGAAWQGVRAVVIGSVDGILREVDLMGSTLVAMLNQLPKVHLTWTSTFGDMAKDMDSQVAEALGGAAHHMAEFENHTNAKGVTEFFDNARKSAEENAKAVADAADKMHGAFSPSQTMFKEGAAPMDEAVKQYKDHLKDLASEAGKIKEAMEPPEEKLADYASKLQEMVDNGLLTGDQAAAALAKQADDAAKGLLGDSSEKQHQNQFASFIQAGSNEAAKLQFSLRSGVDNDVPSKQLAEQQKANELLANLVGKFDFVPVNG